jgi:hypothetical protein
MDSNHCELIAIPTHAALQRIGAQRVFRRFIVDAPTSLRTTELSKGGYIGNSRSAHEMVLPCPGKHAGGIGLEI